MAIYEKRRFLIWGKTTPELSTKYFETVCTGAVLEDGSPIRLYPIPFRYLEDGDKFKKYQWLTARIAKSGFDARPESYKVDCDSIEPGPVVPTNKNEWQERQRIMFQNPSWQFDSMDDLTKAQAQTKRSIAVIAPTEILAVELHPRPDEDAATFEQKRDRLRKKWEKESDGGFSRTWFPTN